MHLACECAHVGGGLQRMKRSVVWEKMEVIGRFRTDNGSNYTKKKISRKPVN